MACIVIVIAVLTWCQQHDPHHVINFEAIAIINSDIKYPDHLHR